MWSRFSTPMLSLSSSRRRRPGLPLTIPMKCYIARPRRLASAIQSFSASHPSSLLPLALRLPRFHLLVWRLACSAPLAGISTPTTQYH
ncbi:hypothetical protein BDZ89DRAFT_274 [Hymenopellis radicata]|nr:hypothetical protein BDZ89DRAFT_274 [Hymenopellis radicata]